MSARLPRRIRIVTIRPIQMLYQKKLDNPLICSLDGKIKSLVLDSRASFHATISIELLKNYLSSNLGKMYLSDNQMCDVIGKGEVHIKLNGFI